MIRMRVLWLKRPVLTLGGIGLFLFLGMFLKSGYEQTVVADKELDTLRSVRSFSDLKANISGICEFFHPVMDECRLLWFLDWV